MKYEVIGWTYPCDARYPMHGFISPCVDRAVIAELKRGGYAFRTEGRSLYLPVLNDGTCVDYSQDGWNRVMAAAWGGDTGWLDGRGNCPGSGVDTDRILWREQLCETFTIPLSESEFEAARDGSMRILARIYDDFARNIDIDDFIVFTCGRGGKLKVQVTDVHIAENFEKLLSKTSAPVNGGEGKLAFDVEEFGFQSGTSIAEAAAALRAEGGEEGEREFGAAAFAFTRSFHSCKTYVRTNVLESADIAAVERALYAVSAEWQKTENSFSHNFGYTIGMNTEYRTDVNIMIRKTIGELVGKEEALKKIAKEAGLKFYLVIVPEIAALSDVVSPILSLEDDIIEFLYKSGVKMDLDYYILADS